MSVTIYGSGQIIVQTVQYVNTNTSSVGTGSWLQGNLSGSITPKSASNKILVIFDLANAYINGSDVFTYITRNGTNLFSSYTTGNSSRGGVTGYSVAMYSSGRCNPVITYLDSPATTSACTYSWHLYNATGSTGYDNYPNDRGVQTLTLMEVSG